MVLKFQHQQIVISAIAGISIEQLSTYSNLNECELVRTLPGVSAEVNAGAVPQFPANDIAFDLLKGLGQVVVLDNESQFELACTFGCLHGWLYFWFDELVSWTHNSGMDPQQAKQMVLQTIQGAISFSDKSNASLTEIGNQIATPGTYTLKGLEQFKSNGAFELWSETLEQTLINLKK